MQKFINRDQWNRKEASDKIDVRLSIHLRDCDHLVCKLERVTIERLVYT